MYRDTGMLAADVTSDHVARTLIATAQGVRRAAGDVRGRRARGAGGRPARADVQAAARITAVLDGRGATALPVLESDGPLALRRTRATTAPYARVTVVGAMSAPLGGDRLSLAVRVEEGARLTVDSAAATVALPGPGRIPQPASYDIALTVGERAVLN